MFTQQLKVILFGSKGQLGQALCQHPLASTYQLVVLSREDCDLTNSQQLLHLLDTLQPDCVINAAAYTAVDRAEEEPSLAHLINAEVPGIMASWAAQQDALLVHFSTDYVFDGSGQKPWQEHDLPSPLNIYGKSKLAGEQAILQTACRCLIFRTSWVYAPWGHNFLLTMLRLAKGRSEISVVNDQWGTPTSVQFIAHHVLQILEQVGQQKQQDFPSGIYHLVPKGFVTWHDFACLIFEQAMSKGILPQAPQVVPVTSASWPAKATRPQNSRLSTHKVATTFTIEFGDWSAALIEVLEMIASSR